MRIPKPLFAKSFLLDTACTWYDSQGYNETMVIFATVKSYMLDYFIPSDYVRRARRTLPENWCKDRPQST